jgi:two-component system response regulator DevR
MIRVFLLDDHELLRRGLRDLLEGAGDIQVVGESSSVQDAVERIAALQPDVALLEVRLPDGSGIEVCRWARTASPAMRSLMVTTFDRAARQAAILAGAAGFVLKQIRGDELVAAIRRVAAGEVLLEEPPARQEPVFAHPTDPRLAQLTAQERRVLDLVSEGLTNRDIGERLGIGEKTVRNHVSNVLAKLGLSGRTQAAVYAITHAPPR